MSNETGNCRGLSKEMTCQDKNIGKKTLHLLLEEWTVVQQECKQIGLMTVGTSCWLGWEQWRGVSSELVLWVVIEQSMLADANLDM